MSEAPYDTAAEVQKHLDAWNPPPDDSGVTHLVGEQSGREAPLNPTNSKVDAGRPDQYPEAFRGDQGSSTLPAVPTDEDGNPDYHEMRNEDLQAHLEARGLPKSGSKADMVDRLEEDDDSEDDDSDN